MTDLWDIGPATKPVIIRDQVITAHGLTAEDIFYLIATFEEVRLLMEGKPEAIDFAALYDKAPNAIAAIQALGTIERDDFVKRADWVKAVVERTAKARKLPLPKQLELVNAVVELTFEEAGGTGPFLENLKQLMKNLGMTVPKEMMSSQEAASTPSQGPLPTVLITDTPRMLRGSIHPSSSMGGLN